MQRNKQLELRAASKKAGNNQVSDSFGLPPAAKTVAPAETKQPNLKRKIEQAERQGKRQKKDPASSKKSRPQKRKLDQEDDRPKKKRRNIDLTYHPNSRKGSWTGKVNKEAFLKMRQVDFKDTVTRSNGDVVEKKVAVLFRKKTYETQSPNSLFRTKGILKRGAYKAKNSRKIIEVIKSPNGTARQAVTPDTRTVLNLRDEFGEFNTYTNHSPLPPTALPPIDEKKAAAIKSSESFQVVQENKGKTEFAEVLITAEVLKEALQQIENNKGRRIKSQAAAIKKPGANVKKVSSNKYGKLYYDHLRYEIMHFIAHRSLGDRSQHEQNMGIGSFDANTQMIFVEIQHKELAEFFGKGFWIKPVPFFNKDVEGSQLLERLDYYVEGGQGENYFKWQFVFPCLKDVPCQAQADVYVGSLFSVPKKLNEALSPETTKLMNSPSLILFSPPPKQYEDISKKLTYEDATVMQSDGSSAFTPEQSGP